MADEPKRGGLLKWGAVVPGIVAAVLSISGLIGAHAVLAYRVEEVERDVRADKAALADSSDRLARIEGKLDILLDRLRERP